MAQMTKEFAETLLQRVQSGKHINTTVWEEEQLIRGWLFWYQRNHNYRAPEKAANTSDDPQSAAGEGKEIK